MLHESICGNEKHHLGNRKEKDMTRNEYDIALCWDEETNEFDWDTYQYLCDIAEYWDCEE